MSVLRSLFSRSDSQPRYRLYDTWEPGLHEELLLLVSSFHADKSFHKVFGEGRELSKECMTWHFAGLVLARRLNPQRYIVTVRKDREVVALVAGSLMCGISTINEVMKSLEESGAEITVRATEDAQGYVERHRCVVESYGALEDKRFEARVEQYFAKLHACEEDEMATPAYFAITTIAVHPDEQGLGHLRAMLERLVRKMQKMRPVQYIQVSTFDKSKAEIYQGLGFEVFRRMAGNGPVAWVLRLPMA